MIQTKPRYLCILCLFTFYYLGYISTAFAFGWKDLWLRPDQQAKRLLDAGKMHQAAIRFKNPEWKGIAYYRAGLYSSAVNEFAKGNSSLNYYNRGNALAHLGEYSEAVFSYEQALKCDPFNEDAKYNRDLLKKYLR